MKQIIRMDNDVCEKDIRECSVEHVEKVYRAEQWIIEISKGI